MTLPHNRRPGYWQYYEMARKTEEEFVSDTVIELIGQNPHPGRRTSPRGRMPAHARDKLDFACFAMTSSNDTYRGARDGLRHFRHVWNEPLPDHTEIVAHMQTVDTSRLDLLVAKSAFLCLEELAAGDAAAPLGADSSAFETTRYRYAENPNASLDDFAGIDTEQSRAKIYLKYHITAVLGHQIILAAVTTPGNVHDGTMLPVMLEMVKKFGFDFYGRDLIADRGYDAENNFRIVMEMGMIPLIKQRRYSSKPYDPAKTPETYRELAAQLFDPSRYDTRALIEGIFGAEETRRHQLHCRFLLEENRERFSKFRAIAWNLRVLNRFVCANRLGIPIPSYGNPRCGLKKTGLESQILAC